MLSRILKEYTLVFLYRTQMKKLLTILMVPLVGFLGITAVNAQFQTENPYEVSTNDGGVQNVNVIWQWSGQQDAFVNVVRGVINWTLWILAFIALIILLYGGFLMVTAAWNDDRYTKWFTILKQAAIWLILIGVAWFVVSIIFRLINLVGQASQGQTANTGG